MSSKHELIGSQLGRYQIIEHLATGGMAEIFLARHQAVGRFKKQLVLKVLQTRWEEYPEVVELFLGEARLSALMDHPNIVDVYDVAEENGRHFIAMEHIAGKTLTELAKRAIAVTKSIPIEVGVFIAAEIAGALAYMYDGSGAVGEPLRVVHRDVSPTNVLVGNCGEIKLIDFGIARQGLSVVEESGVRPGKVTYMSPEQVTGAPLDGRSDIFCLGTILYEITLGRRLWRGPREVASRRIVEERPKPPTFVRQEYPPELELIVLRTLEKKPEDRYQTATELYNDLHGFLASSNAHLRNNCQMADYLRKIFSEEADALISEVGRKRAQAFVEGNEMAEPDREDLDFDVQQLDGPGAALARALRASALGIWADVDTQRAKSEATPEGAESSNDQADGESLFSETAVELRRAAADVESSKSDAESSSADPAAAVGPVEDGQTAAAESSENKQEQMQTERTAAQTGTQAESGDDLPSVSSNAAIVVGVALLVAAVVGIFLWLRGG
jgi:serine/threonine protein kinase